MPGRTTAEVYEEMRSAGHLPPEEFATRPSGIDDELNYGEYLEEAGFTQLWNTRTGEASIIHKNSLGDHLSRVFPDGSGEPVWQARPTDFEPVRGTILCALHKNATNREAYDRVGYAYCNKSNLRTMTDYGRHMARRHRDEWTAIMDEERRVREEEREGTQKAQVEAFQAIAQALVDQGRIPDKGRLENGSDEESTENDD